MTSDNRSIRNRSLLRSIAQGVPAPGQVLRQVNELLQIGSVENHQDGERIIAEGADGDTFYAILGRTAAWRHGKVTWDEMMSAAEALEPDLGGLRS